MNMEDKSDKFKYHTVYIFTPTATFIISVQL